MYISNKLYQQDIERIITNDFSSFANKTFFITGSSGLVGSCLIDVLMYLNLYKNFNTKIYATFSNEKSLKERFISYDNNPLFIPVIQNIIEPVNTDAKIDYIVHCASNTHPKLYATQPVETAMLNVSGTNNILSLAKKSNAKKMLFLSTLEVYGENKDLEMFSENDFGFIDYTQIRSCYPISKIMAENLCLAYSHEYNLNIAIGRLGYIYGPTVKLNSSKADVQFLNNALNNENIVMKSQGLQKRSYCYVLDTASAILTILLKGENSSAYNIASKNGNVQLRDYANTIANLVNTKVIYEEQNEIEKTGGSKVNNSTLNSSKLEQLGWESKFTFKEGIEHTLQIKKAVLNK